MRYSPSTAPPKPTQAPLPGVERMARLSRLAKLPVFALGGVDQRHRGWPSALGAQGVAGIGGFGAVIALTQPTTGGLAQSHKVKPAP